MDTKDFPIRCITCREEDGGAPKCRLGIMTQKGKSHKRLVTHVEMRGRSASRAGQYSDEIITPHSIMVVLPSPDWEEDAGGRPFEGSVSTKVVELLTKAGLNLDAVWLTYMAKCKPPKGRKASTKEIQACAVHIKQELQLVQPKHVILLGTEALKLFKLHAMGGVNAIHGQHFEKPFRYWSEGEEEGPTFTVLASWNPGTLVHNYNPALEERMVQDYRTVLGKKPVDPLNAPYRLCDTLEKVEDLVKEISEQPWFAFDTESTSLGFYRSPMLCMSLTWKRVRNGPGAKCLNAIIPLYRHDDQPHVIEHDGRFIKPHDPKRGPGFFSKPVWTNAELIQLRVILARLFENPAIGKAAHNIKYDFNVVRYWLGLKLKGFLFDTMLMHHILDENPPHALEPLADVEFNVGDYSAPLHAITGWGKNLLKTFDHVPDELLWPYGANDSECVYRLCEVYYNRLQAKPHLWKLYCEESEPSIRTLATAEWHGSLVDERIVLKLKDEYEEAQENLLVKMRKEIPPKPDCPEFQFNPMSTQQVRDAFIDLGFNDLIMDKHSPSGYNTSKEVLLKIKEGSFEPTNETASSLAGWILDYRTNKKILSTYLENALNDVDDDGRSRYSWMAHGTTSGRLSCRFLHQIPRASEKRAAAGKLNLRDMFVVRQGYKYVYFDYSQIELRVLALLADDAKMISMFVNDEDIHAATAECILEGLPYSMNKDGTEPSKFNRGVGKTMNFGLAYGSEGHQLVKTGEWEDNKGDRHPVTWDMVKLGRARFSDLFPQVVDYLTNTPDLARLAGGTLVTPFGRERRMGSKLNDRLDTTRKAAERESVNFTIQSTAGAVCVRTLNLIHQQLEQLIDNGHLLEDDAFLINTVHDSGAYEVREDLVDWFQTTILKPTAERTIPEIQNSYFKTDMGVGNNWTQAESG